MSLLDDLAAPRSHSAVQQALADAVRICARQIGDVIDGFLSHDPNALAVTLELHVTLKDETISVY